MNRQSYLLPLLLLGSITAHAHGGHVHEPALEAPPHGGLLRDAGVFKSEVVMKGDLAKVYVYDRSLKPLTQGPSQLKADFQLPKQKKSKPVVFQKKDDHYEAVLPGVSRAHRFDMHVYIELEGKKGTADFGVDNME